MLECLQIGEIDPVLRKDYKDNRKCKPCCVPDDIVVWQRNGFNQYYQYLFTSDFVLISCSVPAKWLCICLRFQGYWTNVSISWWKTHLDSLFSWWSFLLVCDVPTATDARPYSNIKYHRKTPQHFCLVTSLTSSADVLQSWFKKVFQPMFKPRQPKFINSMQSCRVEVSEFPVRFSGNFSLAFVWILLGYSKKFFIANGYSTAFYPL